MQHKFQYMKAEPPNKASGSHASANENGDFKNLCSDLNFAFQPKGHGYIQIFVCFPNADTKTKTEIEGLKTEVEGLLSMDS